MLDKQTTQVKSNRGGKRTPAGGRPVGYRVTMATREKIRGAMLVKQLEKIAKGEIDALPHQVTAALGLLKFCLPTLQATDITSGGEALTIERSMFKPRNAK